MEVKRVRIRVPAPKERENRKVIKSIRGMPRLSEAMKDVVSCEKLRGSAHSDTIRRCPNGATPLVGDQGPGNGGKPGELKHLSNRRKRKQ